MLNINAVQFGKEVRPLQVGDKVRLQVLKYQNFQGTVVEITPDKLVVNVPTYYGTKTPIVKEFGVAENGDVQGVTFVNTRPIL